MWRILIIHFALFSIWKVDIEWKMYIKRTPVSSKKDNGLPSNSFIGKRKGIVCVMQTFCCCCSRRMDFLNFLCTEKALCKFAWLKNIYESFGLVIIICCSKDESIVYIISIVNWSGFFVRIVIRRGSALHIVRKEKFEKKMFLFSQEIYLVWRWRCF